jgi:polysaccharide biosynthesis protein PelF
MKAPLEAPAPWTVSERLFSSFFMGGFECSTHRLRSGRRLDLVSATAHDRFCAQDYARLRSQGLRVAREGIRWHLIEQKPGRYDFSSVLPMVTAAREHDIEVLWDLCHYGWPDDIDIFKPEFVERYRRFVRHFAAWLAREIEGPFFFAPINEISFFAWAGGDDPHLNPYCTGRGFELKCQLVRAALEGMNALWDVLPAARILHVDPLVHIVADPSRPEERGAAEAYRLAQFQAFDLLAGRIWPQLGGEGRYLDIIGLNFYPNNEWIYHGPALEPGDPLYRPLRHLLREVWRRYVKPIFISETGTECERRGPWLRYICDEVRAAMASGIPVHGICLYPIVNHPGWINRRHCQNGLWDYPDPEGERAIYEPLAAELQRGRKLFGEVDEGSLPACHSPPTA